MEIIIYNLQFEMISSNQNLSSLRSVTSGASRDLFYVEFVKYFYNILILTDEREVDQFYHFLICLLECQLSSFCHIYWFS